MSNRVKIKTKTRWLHLMSFDWHRRFTFTERLKILFGGGCNVLMRVPCQHVPGNYQPIVKAIVGPDINFHPDKPELTDPRVKAFDEQVAKEFPIEKY